MKKLLSLCAVLLIFTFNGYCQFSKSGYGNLRLGLTDKQLNRLISNLTIKNEYATVNFSGVTLRLQFYEAEKGKRILYSVESKSPGAKLEGILQEVMGKSYQEMKKQLGGRIQPAPFQEGSGFPKDCMYVRDKADKDAETICILQFDQKGILNKIIAVYAP